MATPPGFPPIPPPIAPPPPKKSSLVPLLVVGAIGLITAMAAFAAGLMIFFTTRAREVPRPPADLPVVEAPREPEPAPAVVEPEAQKPPVGVVGNRLGEAPKNAPRPPPPRPLMVGGKIPTPTKIHNVPPVYPQIAVSARVQGTVVIEATIGPDGKVKDARVVRSVPLLDQAALDAVRQWEYEPTRLNGVAVPVIMTVTVRFSLQ